MASIKGDISVMPLTDLPIKLNTSEIIYEVFKQLEDVKMGFRKDT